MNNSSSQTDAKNIAPTFNEYLSYIRKTLADRELLGEVAKRADCGIRTVQYALTATSIDELKGKKYKAYIEAEQLKNEVEQLYKKFNKK